MLSRLITSLSACFIAASPPKIHSTFLHYQRISYDATFSVYKRRSDLFIFVSSFAGAVELNAIKETVYRMFFLKEL